MQLNTYVHFNGNCEAAFRFYEQHLGGENVMLMTYGQAPPGQPISPDWKDKIMHGRMDLGDRILMGMDAPNERFHKPQGFSLSLETKDVNEAERMFNALVQGGQTIMPMQETFWAARFGMLVDQFGIPWMVNCEKTA